MQRSKRFLRDFEALQKEQEQSSQQVAGIRPNENLINNHDEHFDCFVSLFRHEKPTSAVGRGTWEIGILAEDFPMKAPKITLLAPHPLHPSLQGHGPSLLNPHIDALNSSKQPWSPYTTLLQVVQRTSQWLRDNLPHHFSNPIPNEGHAFLKCDHQAHEHVNITGTHQECNALNRIGITFFENTSHHVLQLRGFFNSVDCGSDLFHFGTATLVYDHGDDDESNHRDGESNTHSSHSATRKIITLQPGQRIGFGNLVLRLNSCYIGERILLAETIPETPLLDVEGICTETSTPIYFEEWLLSWDGAARRLRAYGYQSPRHADHGGSCKSKSLCITNETPEGGLAQEGGIRATHWGITLRQIRELLQQTGQLPTNTSDENDNYGNDRPPSPTCVAEDMSVYEFVRHYIRPMTADKGRGYALCINQEAPLEVQVMVSHTWHEGIIEFYDALCTTLDDSTPLFVCFLSMYQNDGEFDGVTIDQQLGEDPTKGPFAEVLNHFKNKPAFRVRASDMREVKKFDREYATNTGYRSKPNMSCGFMVVVPTMYANNYTRMWCCLELFTAAKEGIPIFITKLPSAVLDGTVSVRDARCGPPGTTMNHDEVAIRAAIENGVGYDFVDKFIAGFTAIHAKNFDTSDLPQEEYTSHMDPGSAFAAAVADVGEREMQVVAVPSHMDLGNAFGIAGVREHEMQVVAVPSHMDPGSDTAIADVGEPEMQVVAGPPYMDPGSAIAVADVGEREMQIAAVPSHMDPGCAVAVADVGEQEMQVERPEPSEAFAAVLVSESTDDDASEIVHQALALPIRTCNDSVLDASK